MRQTDQTNNSSVENLKLLTVKQLTVCLQVSKSQAYHLLDTNQIASVRIGRSVRIRTIDLDRFIQKCLTGMNS
jgi:excisionase family DNA binding protein